MTPQQLQQQVAIQTGEDLDFVRGQGFDLLKPDQPLPSAESLIASWKEKEWGPPPEESVSALPEKRPSLVLI